MLREDSYGRRKRFEFVAQALRERAPSRVLDIGCGTGVYLTLPIAQAFPNIRFLGVDSDMDSIAQARAVPHPPNVEFGGLEVLSGSLPFDLVIASEILEHVDEPPAFLERLVGLTCPDGRLIVTVPNGYGPFEQCALMEALLNLSGIQAVLRKMKRRNILPPPLDKARAPTLAVSPHANFFSRHALLRLFDEAGLVVYRYRPTTFLCGYGLDSLIRSRRIVAWNTAVADRLPHWCASDWMFELSPSGHRKPSTWRRNAWGRFRRWLNRRRWSLA